MRRSALLRSWRRQLGNISQALSPLLVDVEHARRGFEELRQARDVVADVVAQLRIARRRRAIAAPPTDGSHRRCGRTAPPVICADHAIFASDRIPLLAVVGRLDQRISKIAQLRARRRSVRSSTARSSCRRSRRADPIVDVVAHQRGPHFAEIAVGVAPAEQRERGERENVPAPNGRPRQRRRRMLHRWLGGRLRSARDAAAAAAAG